MQKAAEYDFTSAIYLPVSERVLDKLADILFATDELLDMIHAEETVFDANTQAVESTANKVYHQVNELMKTLAD